MQPIRWKAAALAEQRHGGGNLKSNLAQQTVASAGRAPPAGAIAELIASDAHRISVLESLDRCIERIAHMGMDARKTIQTGTSAHTAAHRFIVSKWLLRTRIDAARCDIV